MPSPSRGSTRITISQDILARIEQIKPQYMDLTTFVNFQLDTCITLTEPKAAPQAGTLTQAKSLKNVVNKRNIDVSLQAEEAHVEPEALEAVKRKPTFLKTIPPNLVCHEDLIDAYWKAKPKTKSQAAWNLLMGELTRMQDRYGESVVRDQLRLAEANRWQGVSVRNFEQFGMNRPNAPKQASVAAFDWESINGMSI